MYQNLGGLWALKVYARYHGPQIPLQCAIKETVFKADIVKRIGGIHFAIPSLRICWKMVTIFGRYRSCLATRISVRR